MKGKADPYKFGFANNSMEYKLEELFDLQMGKTPSRSNADYWNSNDNKWISISDLSKCEKYINDTKECISNLAVKESGISLIPENTVIMSFKLSIGKTAITAEPIYSNEAIMAFVDKNTVDLLPDYVYYLFSGKNWSEGTNKAVKGTTLNKATLSKVKVRIHDIDKQRIIVSTLDKLQSVIAKRKQQLEKLDQLVKARFVEMFGDPQNNPYSWKKEIIEQHIDLLSGYPFKSENYVDSGINICGGLIIMPQRIEWEKCVHWPTTDGYEDYLLEDGDIVMALDRPWITEGFKIAIVEKKDLPALLIQRTARIRAIDINPKYLYYCFLDGGFNNHTNITGSLVPHISAKDIRSYEIMIPPIELQEEFAAFVEQIDKSKAVVEKSYK